MAWLAAPAAYVAAAWMIRFLLTVLTLPLAGLLRSPRPLPVLRAMRLGGSAACGLGGFLTAAWVLARFGQHPLLLLGIVLGAGVGVLNSPGLRRLAGGPQLAEESFSLIGEELGLLAAAAWWIAA